MKVSDHNKMVKYITDPRDRKSPEERAKITATQKANDAKRMAAKRKEYGLPDMQKHTINMLNKFENGPDIKEEDFYVQAIRNSPTPVPGYVGGATPDPTVPTRAERIAGQKQLEKLAVQPDSRGVFQKAVAADEAAYKKSQQYPNEATPEQVAMLAYNMEKSRQMTGGDGRYDKPKAIIKKKKTIPYVPTKIKFNTYQPYIPEPPSPELIRQSENFKKILQDTQDKKIREANAGLAGLLGGFKK
tara:strand:- start:551 stop:1282 length:732 start_codon:yes stop_codon:yes gene_type:complete